MYSKNRWNLRKAVRQVKRVSDVEAGAVRRQIMLMNVEIMLRVRIRVMLDLDKPDKDYQ